MEIMIPGNQISSNCRKQKKKQKRVFTISEQEKEHRRDVDIHPCSLQGRSLRRQLYWVLSIAAVPLLTQL